MRMCKKERENGKMDTHLNSTQADVVNVGIKSVTVGICAHAPSYVGVSKLPYLQRNRFGSSTVHTSKQVVSNTIEEIHKNHRNRSNC